MREYLEKEPEVTEQPITPAFCAQCGTRLTAGQKFCPSCGYAVAGISAPVTPAVATPTPAVTVVPETAKAPEKKDNPKKFIVGVIKHSVVLLLAILMLVSLFVPMLELKVDLKKLDGCEYKGDVTLSYNTLDGLGLFANSLDSIDWDEWEDEGEALSKDFYEEYAEDWQEGENLNQYARFIKEVQSLYMRYEEYPSTLGMATVAVLSILQIVVVILLLVFAAISFAFCFIRKKGFPRLSFALLGLSVVLALTNAFAFRYEFGLHVGHTSIAAMPIVCAILTLLAAIGFLVLRLVFDRDKIRVGTIVKCSLSLGLAVVLFAFAFAPIVSTKLKATFEDTDAKVSGTLDSSLFYALSMSESKKEALEDMTREEKHAVIQSTYATFENYTKRDFNNGKADGLNRDVYSTLLLYLSSGYKFDTLFSFGAVALILLVLCALLMLWQNVYEMATGNRLHLSVSIATKVVAILMAVVVVALAIAMSMMVNYNAKISDLSYQSSIAYGPIVLLIVAIAAICIPPAISKKAYKAMLAEKEE